jgi:hypothetical protein
LFPRCVTWCGAPTGSPPAWRGTPANFAQVRRCIKIEAVTFSLSRFIEGGDGAELRFGQGAPLVGDSVLSHGSPNLAQFRSGFDFFGAGLGLFFAFCFLDYRLLQQGKGFWGVMVVKVFGFNGIFS